MGLHREPHGCDESELIVQTLSANATGILGITPKIAGAAYWTDCAILSSVGIPSLLFGPSGEGAHAAVEWVDLASVEQCVSIYLETIKAFCA